MGAMSADRSCKREGEGGEGGEETIRGDDDGVGGGTRAVPPFLLLWEEEVYPCERVCVSTGVV